MRRGALVQKGKPGVFSDMPEELEGQARLFGPWYGQGPKDDLFRVKLLGPCTVYMVGGCRTGGAEWEAKGWTRLKAQVMSRDPASGKQGASEVWKTEAGPGELKLPRDKHNFMMNFVFAPRGPTSPRDERSDR